MAIIFSHHFFHFLLFVSLPNAQKWAENGPRMATVNNPNPLLMAMLLRDYWSSVNARSGWVTSSFVQGLLTIELGHKEKQSGTSSFTATMLMMFHVTGNSLRITNRI